MRKNAFTLIELLAVIVVLAIIALIAVPIVVNIINDTKENSKNRSAEIYIDTVNKSISRSQLENKKIFSGTYIIQEDNSICLIENNECINNSKINIDLNKIKAKTGGKIIIDEKGINYAEFEIEDVVYKYTRENGVERKLDPYIESDGSSYLIIPNIKNVKETDTRHLRRIEVKFKVTKKKKKNYLFGQSRGYSYDYGINLNTEESSLILDYRRHTKEENLSYDDKKHKIELIHISYPPKIIMDFDSKEFLISQSEGADFKGQIALFASYYSYQWGYSDGIRIYEVTVYDDDDITPISHCMPVVLDGVPTMYDDIQEVYLDKYGTGTFKYGKD